MKRKEYLSNNPDWRSFHLGIPVARGQSRAVQIPLQLRRYFSAFLQCFTHQIIIFHRRFLLLLQLLLARFYIINLRQIPTALSLFHHHLLISSTTNRRPQFPTDGLVVSSSSSSKLKCSVTSTQSSSLLIPLKEFWCGFVKAKDSKEEGEESICVCHLAWIGKGERAWRSG